MPDWLRAEYRDFEQGAPRQMVCIAGRGTFFFLSPYDGATGRYADHYEVYQLPALGEGEVCASWFGLETRALARLADLPVARFPFDPVQRAFLPYDAIADALKRPSTV